MQASTQMVDLVDSQRSPASPVPLINVSINTEESEGHQEAVIKQFVSMQAIDTTPTPRFIQQQTESLIDDTFYLVSQFLVESMGKPFSLKHRHT